MWKDNGVFLGTQQLDTAQDCETKVFKRLVPSIKQTFPRQPIVHLLDSLYAQGSVFDLLTGAKHQFICCFKEGSIPTQRRKIRNPSG